MTRHRIRALPACAVAVLSLIAPHEAFADDSPEPMFAGSVRAGGGVVRVEGKDKSIGVTRTPGARKTVTETRFRPTCWIGAEPILAATASCEPEHCELDGVEGEIRARFIRRVDAETGELVSPWTEVGSDCRATSQAPDVSVDELVRREFEAMKLPGLEVQTFPAGGTLVNLPTTFSVEKPEKEHKLGRILGRRVTVVIRPVGYRWEFGDGAGETTEAAHARHTFGDSATVRASVTTEYRARYRVDGGRAREIPGTVSVEGPETELTVRQARSELIAGPR